MFVHVYQNPVAKGEEGKAEGIVETLYEYYLRHIDKLPKDLLTLVDQGEYRERIVCDYISSMTDRFARAQYEELFIPKSWHY